MPNRPRPKRGRPAEASPSRKRYRLAKPAHTKEPCNFSSDQHKSSNQPWLIQRFAALRLNDPISLLHLPDDIFYLIFGHFGSRNSQNMALVCSRMARLICHKLEVSAVATAERIRPWLQKVFPYRAERWKCPSDWLRSLHFRENMATEVVAQMNAFRDSFLASFPVHQRDPAPECASRTLWPSFSRPFSPSVVQNHLWFDLSRPQEWVRLPPTTPPVSSQTSASTSVVSQLPRILRGRMARHIGAKLTSPQRYRTWLTLHFNHQKFCSVLHPSLEKWTRIATVLLQTLTWHDTTPQDRVRAFVFDAPLTSILLIRFLTLWYDYMYSYQHWRAWLVGRVGAGAIPLLLHAGVGLVHMKRSIKGALENRMLATGETVIRKGEAESSFLHVLRSHLADDPWSLSQTLPDLESRVVRVGGTSPADPQRLDRIISVRISLELGCISFDDLPWLQLLRFSQSLAKLEREGALKGLFEDIRCRGGDQLDCFRIDDLSDLGGADGHGNERKEKKKDRVAADLYVFLADNEIPVPLGI